MPSLLYSKYRCLIVRRQKKTLYFYSDILRIVIVSYIVYYDNEVKWIADLDDVVTKPVAQPLEETEKPEVRLRQENVNKKAE
mgnify:FL=1